MVWLVTPSPTLPTESVWALELRCGSLIREVTLLLGIPRASSCHYHLVMTNSSPWYRWPIYRWFTELKNGGSFHGYVTNNQMVSRISLTAESFDWPNLIRYSWPNAYKTNSGQSKSCRQVQDNSKLFSFSEMSRLHLNYQQILLTITKSLKSLSITIIVL